MDNVYRAMPETVDVSEDDLFMTVSEHEDDDFLYGATYLGIVRSDDLVIIQITAADTHTTHQKKALYWGIADRLAADPGLRSEDVFISLVEIKKENWSFGRGDAQYARSDREHPRAPASCGGNALTRSRPAIPALGLVNAPYAWRSS